MIGSELFSTNKKVITEKRRKKTSIRGVLDKKDLAEVYNCTKKSKQKHGDDKSPIDLITTPVQAVEFKEANIEDLLPAISRVKEESTQCQRKLSTGGDHFLEAVRRVSQANILRPNNLNINNNNEVSKRQAVISTGQEVEQPSADNPDGYEPENSLRRVSVAVAPTQLKRGGAIRRRSALDRPTKPIIPESTQPVEKEVASYEPENSLRRVRKKSDQANSGLNKGRQRRTGLVLVAPTLENVETPSAAIVEESDPPAKPEDSSENAKHSDDSSTHSACDSGFTSDNPPSPRSPGHKPVLFSLCIPENGEVSSEGSTTPSPTQTRRVSRTRPSRPSKLSIPSVVVQPSSPKVQKSTSVPTTLSTTSSRLRKQSATRKVSSASTPALAPLSEVTSPAAETTPKPRLTKNSLCTNASHNNATRYWDWYLLNSTYTWHGFNTDKRYCY